jgi:FkbM family methyltransferase
MDKNDLYDLQTKKVIQNVLTSNSNCVDVGCHTGKILDILIHYAPNGTHYGFEPLPELFLFLLDKYSKTESVKIFDVALSNSNGNQSFNHVVSNPGYSGLKKRRYDRPNETLEKITVKTSKLDDIIPPEIEIDFIKIDVEGAELGVLQGAFKTILGSKPVIVFEHGLGSADYYNTEPEQVYDFLVDECKLSCFLMNEWLISDGLNVLDRNSFCDEFRSGRNYYFMAAPK